MEKMISRFYSNDVTHCWNLCFIAENLPSISILLHNRLVDDIRGQYCLVVVHPYQIKSCYTRDIPIIYITLNPIRSVFVFDKRTQNIICKKIIYLFRAFKSIFTGIIISQENRFGGIN